VKPEKQEALLLALKKGWLVAEPETGKCYNARRIGNQYGQQVRSRQIGWLSRTGYLTATIRINGCTYNFKLHQLVWLAARGRIPESKQINHISGVKMDNRIANLELVTVGENQLHAYRSGLRQASKHFQYGEQNGYAKLTAIDVHRIRQLRREGLPVREVAAYFGINPSTVSKLYLRKRWRHLPEEAS